ncbi:hypothetical protein HRbin06_00988 [archaeon HR06]|nr:hypothetical protein HRbin06_00988 [archaeon HR06]
MYIDGLVEPINPGGIGAYAFLIYEGNKKIWEEYGIIGENLSSNQSEYFACIKALEKLLYLNLKDEEILINSDSSLLINQLKGIYRVRSRRILPLYEKVKVLLLNFKKVNFNWIPRKENFEADNLTRKAYLDYIKKLRNKELNY